MSFSPKQRGGDEAIGARGPEFGGHTIGANFILMDLFVAAMVSER